MLFREFRQLEPAALAIWTEAEFGGEWIKLITYICLGVEEAERGGQESMLKARRRVS